MMESLPEDGLMKKDARQLSTGPRQPVALWQSAADSLQLKVLLDRLDVEKQNLGGKSANPLLLAKRINALVWKIKTREGQRKYAAVRTRMTAMANPHSHHIRPSTWIEPGAHPQHHSRIYIRRSFAQHVIPEKRDFSTRR